jgi:hypothetical protein
MVTQLYNSFFYMNSSEKVAWIVFIICLLLSAQEGQRNYRKIKYWDEMRLKQKRLSPQRGQKKRGMSLPQGQKKRK